MELDHIVDVWVAGRQPETVRQYRWLMKRLDEKAKEMFKRGVVFLTVPEITALLREIGRGSSAQTQNVRCHVVKSFFKTVFALQVRRDNPGEQLRPPKFEDTLADRILSLDKILQIIDATKTERDRLLLRTLFVAGLRRSEVVSIKKSDLIKTSGGWSIRVFGKGGKTGYVPVPAEFGDELVAWAAKQGGDYLFTAPFSTRPLTPGSVWHVVKVAAKRVNLDRASTHWFRHSHASIALEKGANLTNIQRTLRHSNVQTTTKYLHLKEGESSAHFLPKV